VAVANPFASGRLRRSGRRALPGPFTTGGVRPEVQMSAYVKTIEAPQFEEQVLAATEPVVLDFFSTECPPCEALAPKYDAVAEQFAGRVRFLKIFRQGSRELATRLGVAGSPTLVFFKGGREVGARMSGEDIKRTALKAAVESLLSRGGGLHAGAL
jgi:thiol-disulfide isomerase/thioredoxin